MTDRHSTLVRERKGYDEVRLPREQGTLCRRCVMHDGLPSIQLGDDGICNNCSRFDELLQQYPLGSEGSQRLERLVAVIRGAGKGKAYDCVVGVSGGTDSTYTLYTACQLGLRPLAVHFDNGWNTHIAVRNIRKALDVLRLDLWTYVVDWDEFRDLQLSFLKAGVPSVEVPTDMGIWSVLYRAAAKHGIRYVISGNCFRAEGVVPRSWGRKDARLIKSIQHRWGGTHLSSFPNLTIWDYIRYGLVRRVKIIRLLNYFDYGKEEAKALLQKELDWTDYGGHHHESIYTRFFQSFLAREKFNMDRRRTTLSARVRLNKISRQEALRLLDGSDYTDFLREDDRKYVAKKLGITPDELEEIVVSPPCSDLDYPSYHPFLKRVQFLLDMGRRVGVLRGVFQSGRFG